MYYLMMQQEVADYEKWRAVFDSMATIRHEAGVRSDLILRDSENPNHIILLIEWDSHESARAWMNDPRLGAALKDAGVLSRPVLTYLVQS